MYILYGKKGSGSASIEAALDLAHVEYRVVETASWEVNEDFKKLLAINPIGQIPTLAFDDGTALSESVAILIYLNEAHPAAGLLPQDSRARAQAIRGLVFIAANCYPAVTISDFPERFCTDPDDAMKARIREGTKARLHHHWDIFADMFPARPFLSGDDVGALDLYAAVVSKWSGARVHLEQHRPAFFATLKRIEAHSKVARVFERHWPAR